MEIRHFLIAVLHLTGYALLVAMLIRSCRRCARAAADRGEPRSAWCFLKNAKIQAYLIFSSAALVEFTAAIARFAGLTGAAA